MKITRTGFPANTTFGALYAGDVFSMVGCVCVKLDTQLHTYCSASKNAVAIETGHLRYFSDNASVVPLHATLEVSPK